MLKSIPENSKQNPSFPKQIHFLSSPIVPDFPAAVTGENHGGDSPQSTQGDEGEGENFNTRTQRSEKTELRFRGMGVSQFPCLRLNLPFKRSRDRSRSRGKKNQGVDLFLSFVTLRVSWSRGWSRGKKNQIDGHSLFSPPPDSTLPSA